jgi:hypothetical protein
LRASTAGGRFARPGTSSYHVVLGTGLIVEIDHRGRDLLKTPLQGAGYVWPVLVILVGVLPMINQMAELSDRLENRGIRRGA